MRRARVVSGWWLVVALAVCVPVLCVAWLTAAHADVVHADLARSTCLSAAPAWATVQVLVATAASMALLGGVFTTVGMPLAVGPRWTILIAGGALLAAWALLRTALDPREALGTYGGCGLA